MKRTSKRAWMGVVALVAAAAIMPLASSQASAAGTLQGQALVKTPGGAALNNGDSSTSFTLKLPPSAACGGDSANDGYRVQSYIVPGSVDPGSLTFNGSGPIPLGVGANLRQPLYDTSSSPYVNAQTANAASPGGPGPVVNIPSFNFAVFSPGNIPAGTYNVGIACTLGVASGTQMKEYWNTKMSFTVDAGGGPAQVDWTGGGVPAGNGCNNQSGATISAVLSWYPGVPSSQSSLKAACSFSNVTGGSQVSASYTIHDMRFAQYHNGAARRITVAAAGSGATTLTASPAISGTGMAAWVNRVITGPGLAPRTFVKSISGNTLTLNLPTSGAVAGGSTMIVENAPGARSVTDGVATGTTTLTSATANFTAADADPDGAGPLTGLSVTGTGIPANTFIASVTNATTVTMTNGATLTGGVVNIGATLGVHGSTTQNPVTTTREVTEASITSATVISSTIATWGATDVGLDITGVCDQNTAGAGDDYTIPAGVFITSVAAPNATTTGGLTAGKSGCTLVVGDANANAPVNGAVVADQGMQLDLNPSLVPGSNDCAENQPEGFSVVGTWRNPGSFTGSGVANEQPGAAPTGTSAARDTKAVGQIVFSTSAAEFSAFVLEREPSTPMPSTGAAGATASYPGGLDPIGVRHYDLVVPFAPTALAMCPSNAASPGLTFSLNVHGTTSGSSTLDTGVGRPGTGQVRSVQPSATGGYTGTAYARSDAPAVATNHWLPLANFQRLCVMPPGLPNGNSFQCGAG